MTYSIVARHPRTGEYGIGVQSHYLASGRVVPWVRAGVGAVATQAAVLVSYGPLGLEGLAAGQPVDSVLADLLAADEQRQVRQVAMLDRDGTVAAHTGADCIEHAEHVVGDGYSTQGNMLRSAGIPRAMANAWEQAMADEASTVQGLLAALDAAEAHGGDVRGRQSAAISIASAYAADAVTASPSTFRVDDHPTPLDELRRLVDLHAIYHVEAAEAESLVAAGHPDQALALAESWTERAGGNPEPGFWLGRVLVGAGHPELGAPLVEAAEAVDTGWATLGSWLDAHPEVTE